MIGYLTVGSNDLNVSGDFYDALLGALGAKRAMQEPEFIAWAGANGNTALLAHLPFNGETASVGNGSMIALAAKDKAQVDAVYELAISLGAADEGKPGQRLDNFYAGYFRDPDGNKLNVFFMA